MSYDVRICNCGRVHFIDNHDIDVAISNSKDLMVVCQGCGTAKIIGADQEFDPDLGEVYEMYAFDVSNFTIEPNSFRSHKNDKELDKIIFSEGTQIPMMTGYNATSYYNGKFHDLTYPEDVYKICRKDVTPDDVCSYFDEYDKKRSTVNMDQLINRIGIDEKLEALSRYYVPGLDWSGTKYERR